MKTSNAETGAGPLAGLRRLADTRRPREVCELCDAPIPAEHDHLLEPEKRSLVCACVACALLFAEGRGRYRAVPRRCERLIGFHMSEARWQSLQVPINLVFFFRSTPANAVIALYPSPVGVTESSAGGEGWTELARENPILDDLNADVEALLVNRLVPVESGDRGEEYYRVSIDRCFHLAGLLRKHWRGLSGGTAVWQEVNRFFSALRSRAEDRHV